ncbi:MAG: hypothetical protein O3A00_11180 [Planctomycetota bacterium]|nr:hypothetical protein [Planctomycetota bacterium]
MNASTRWIAVGLFAAYLGCSTFCAESLGQDYRVYTKVYDVREPANNDSKPPVIARSLTIFHAGKTYDYLHSLSEVIIFDPNNHRFLVLNTQKRMATIVDFDVIRRKLEVRTTEMRNHIAELRESGDANVEEIARALQAQLAPIFAQTYDNGTLALTSPYCRYRVRCASVDKPDALKRYLHYADWTARLNCVLNPNAMFPEPRLALNESLRKLGRMPTEVELTARDERTIQLKAEHKISWQLESQDRSLIHTWEQMLKDPKTEFKTFREYQRILFAAK